MKRSLLIFCLIIGGHGISAQTSDNITYVQTRLKAEGFYSGKPTGRFDDETAVALRNFQIRHGLFVSGRLDLATAKELNATAPKPEPTVQSLSGAWRRLPNGEMQFVEDQPPATAAPPAAPGSPTASPAARSQPVPPAEAPPAKAAAAPSPPPPSSPPPPANAAQPPGPAAAGEAENPNRLRSFVEAFVQAGLDQTANSEVRFFADRVDYYGAPNVPREQVQRDLIGYDKKWPHRRFWIDGDIQIQQQRGSNEIKLGLPLRYELHHGSRYATGKVLKTLTLLQTANNELQITAVNESTAP